MAKLVALIASLCFLSLLGAAFSEHEQLEVHGNVYCDTCRVLFETALSEPVAGARVRLECRDRENSKNVTLSVDGVTGEQGFYSFKVEGSHEDEICEVVLVESPDTDCDEIVPGLDRARILISDNTGIASAARFVNSLGFIKKERVSGCNEMLKSYGLRPSAHI